MSFPRYVGSKDGIYKVYMLKIPQTGKKYIGMTGQDMNKRWQAGHGYDGNAELFNDIMKCGWDNVEKIIIAEIDDFETAAMLEGAEIVKHKTTDSEHGYNLWYSGDKIRPVESVGRNISAAKMGHTVSEETRKKLRNYGCVPVVCIDMDGNFVKRYQSLTEAAADVGAHKTNVWAVCKGRKQSCRGFRWVFADRWNHGKRAELKDRVAHGMVNQCVVCGAEMAEGDHVCKLDRRGK